MSELSSFGDLLAIVREAVERQMSEVWEEEIQLRRVEGPAVVEPLCAARDLCSRGGKRLRAALVAAAYCACKSPAFPLQVHVDEIVPVCTAVELMQSYFLIHDDWMDCDDVRRGGPAVHANLRQTGRSEHLAAAGGVLAGDFTLALANRVLSSAPVVANCLPLILEQFSVMQLDAVTGQLLDVLDADPNIERVYELKTGSYTVLGPLKLGGLLSGAGEQWFPELEPYSLAVGVAFQLQDDIIGLLATEAITGKPRGSDLRAGKHTLLCKTALQMADLKGQQTILSVFGNPGASPDQLETAIEVIQKCGAELVVRKRINSLVSSAKQLVEGSSQLTEHGRKLLHEVSGALTSRAC